MHALNQSKITPSIYVQPQDNTMLMANRTIYILWKPSRNKL